MNTPIRIMFFFTVSAEWPQNLKIHIYFHTVLSEKQILNTILHDI